MWGKGAQSNQRREKEGNYICTGHGLTRRIYYFYSNRQKIQHVQGNLDQVWAAPSPGEAKPTRGETSCFPPSPHKLLAEPGGLHARRPHQSTAALLWALSAPVRVRADTLKFTV